MSNPTVARQQTGWLVISTTPDVCKTPMGSSTPPVPYMVCAKLDESVAVVSSVRSNGHPVLVYDRSKIPTTLGDAAGSAGGIKSGTVGGNCYPVGHSDNVRAEGKLLVRHGDEFEMNAP